MNQKEIEDILEHHKKLPPFNSQDVKAALLRIHEELVSAWGSEFEELELQQAQAIALALLARSGHEYEEPKESLKNDFELGNDWYVAFHYLTALSKNYFSGQVNARSLCLLVKTINQYYSPKLGD